MFHIRETNDRIESSTPLLLLVERKLVIEKLAIDALITRMASPDTEKYRMSADRDELKRRRELFGDCALIEIIHLHDCLRGALKALDHDVQALATACSPTVVEIERRVSGRFKVIWSVFRAHSAAEDEFIWPALRKKTAGKVGPRPANDVVVVEQEQYEEDHADEERMFSEMDQLLAKLRQVIIEGNNANVENIAKHIRQRTEVLAQHLYKHLEKEETQCMPLVVKHLSKQEIHELVGQIMGKRSADTLGQIMTMAVQNLNHDDREDMVKYMKQSMAGTFFDRWLLMSGWGNPTDTNNPTEEKKQPAMKEEEEVQDNKRQAKQKDQLQSNKRAKIEDESDTETGEVATRRPSGEITSQAELEKLIRAIATNPALTPEQKNTTIQGLRDSVWKSNQRHKQLHKLEEPAPVVVDSAASHGHAFVEQPSMADPSMSTITANSKTRRVTPPALYYKKMESGKVEAVWNVETPTTPVPKDVPLFSASELAPTYHDGAAGAVLGCPHYARACKLRHPKSGRLYTCRLCCDQQRDLPMKDPDEPLDRYAVSEVMCMQCNALQPAEDRCINPDCESHGKPFAKYFCRICHLYDDGSRPIFHCPYCNTCRLGLGLGIDFRHCMRCNACVSLSDDDHHCIPQKLQGSCPICHETLFQSTEPLRGLKCGHCMHLECFVQYRRGHSYTCPLCMRSMEDMRDYFALLDTAVRMQPMPAAYLNTLSNIYCQDCGQTGQTQYHFVGQKCPHCGSYNSRELGRVQRSP